MSRIPNTHGGGAATNANGLLFEQTTSLNDALINSGYLVSGAGEVYNGKDFLGYSKSKYEFINYLQNNGVDTGVNSDTLLPDDAFINVGNKTIYIIEKKFQRVAGSVDEKLQTCGYKINQYRKLAVQMGFNVKYVYVLNDWFKKPKYDDVREYIIKQGCMYYYNEIPLDYLEI